MSPYVPVNFLDERSAYATLLMHIPWPENFEKNSGESLITYNKDSKVYESAVERLDGIKTTLKDYVTSSLNYQEKADTLLSDRIISSSKTQLYDDTEDYIGDYSYMADIIDNAFTQPSIIISANQEKVLKGLSLENFQYFQNFIQKSMETWSKNYHDENTLQPTSICCSNQYSNNRVVQLVHNYELRTRIHEQIVHHNLDETNLNILIKDIKSYNMIDKLKTLKNLSKPLNEIQKNTYMKITEYLNGRKHAPLLAFLTGGGGVGKSKLIMTIKEYCQLYYGKQDGLYGAVLAMGPTGCASSNIDGFTWQSVLCLKKNIKDDKISDKGIPSQISARKIGAKIKGVKCVILDEISMLSLSNLHIFESRIRHGVATNSDNINERNNILNTPFGGNTYHFKWRFLSTKSYYG